MGFRLTPIFISNQGKNSDIEVLSKLGLSNLEKGKSVNFYDTNKQWDEIFIGTKGDCKIICNGELASEAFGDKNPFLNFNDAEVAVIIWNETSDVYGFNLIQNGKVVRSIMTSDGEIKIDFGNPIPEELEIKEDELFDAEDIEEIMEYEDEEGFKAVVKAEKICRATANLAKRYIRSEIVSISERIELYEYK